MLPQLRQTVVLDLFRHFVPFLVPCAEATSEASGPYGLTGAPADWRPSMVAGAEYIDPISCAFLLLPETKLETFLHRPLFDVSYEYSRPFKASSSSSSIRLPKFLLTGLGAAEPAVGATANGL